MINYNFFDRLNHHFFLSNKIIKKSFFELEKILFRSKINFYDEKHVFITGLPRSGTTLLLELLYKTKSFCSLTYFDMPLIMAPNLFSKFKKKKASELINRYHSDQIKISLSSPESFDEIFFSTFDQESFDQIIKNYRIFVNNVCIKYNKNRYISKNNNNYKRIKLLKKTFKNSTILMMFRNPVDQAFSLLNQHKNFLELQSQNNFVKSYMNYLGHNEFGHNHKFWFKPKDFINLNEINYWLEQWKLYYKYILKHNCNNSFTLICYEQLCLNNLVLKEIEKIIGTDIPNQTLSIKKKKITLDIDKNLVNECFEIYEELKKLTYYTYNISMD